MKHLSVFLIVAFGSVYASHAAELVIKEETGADLFVYLKKVGGSAKAIYPIDNFKEQDNGVARWKNLREGKYRLCLGQTHGSFADYCIVVSDLTITKGSNDISIRLPSDNTLHIELKLQDVAPPRKPEMFLSYWFRIDRINKDGHRDPDYRDWMSTDLKDGIYTGSVSHLAPGTYRISAFHNDEYRKEIDLGYGILEVTEEVLKGGKVSTVIVKPVEQGGADQPATAPQLKSEGKKNTNPQLEVRPR